MEGKSPMDKKQIDLEDTSNYNKLEQFLQIRSRLEQINKETMMSAEIKDSTTMLITSILLGFWE
jgi:hypothetical protein